MPICSHSIRVRYGECGMQGVVFNPNYWHRQFDGMVKKMTVEWFSPATNNETIDFTLEVSRWGNTSFDVTVRAAVGDRRIITAVLVYVSVTPGGKTPCPVPEAVRAALDGRDPVP